MTETFVDTERVILRQINKKVAKEFIVRHHYSHRFSSCRYALGIYYLEEEDHPFFSGENESLIGVMIYGHPVLNRAIQSLTDDDSLETHEVLELTRLVILDGYGKNIESHAIAQSFKWLKENDPSVKILISYADPEYDHNGTIYQATNWLYQGMGYAKLMPNHSIKEHPDGPWIHSRTAAVKWGNRGLENLYDKIGHIFWRKEEPAKHRYIYFLCSKGEKKRLLKKLKTPIFPYPDKDFEWNPPIERIELIDGEPKVLVEDDERIR